MRREKLTIDEKAPMRFVPLSLLALLLPTAAIAETPTERRAVEICTSYGPETPKDFQQEFADGDIVVPAGTVFDGPEHSRRAFITDGPVTLTKQRLCGKVSARVIVSPQWDWTTRTIGTSPGSHYQAYGVVSDDKIDTSFDNEPMPFQWNAQAGTINAVVIRPLDVVYELPPG